MCDFTTAEIFSGVKAYYLRLTSMVTQMASTPHPHSTHTHIQKFLVFICHVCIRFRLHLYKILLSIVSLSPPTFFPRDE